MSVLDRRLADFDPEVHANVRAESERQQRTLEMIASENFAPVSVMEAQGSVLTNKYAEGYPGRRYHGGCEHVDVVEQLAIERVKALFTVGGAVPDGAPVEVGGELTVLVRSRPVAFTARLTEATAGAAHPGRRPRDRP